MLNKIKNLLYVILLGLIIWNIVMTEQTLGRPESTFEIDGTTYMISNMGNDKKDPTELRNIGTRMACDSLGEITGQPVILDASIKDTKSFISGNPIKVNCIEPMSQIAIDYLPERFFKFKDNTSESIYNFYDRFSLNHDKTEILSKKNIKYIKVPWTIDSNYPDKKQKKKIINDYIKQNLRLNEI